MALFAAKKRKEQALWFQIQPEKKMVFSSTIFLLLFLPVVLLLYYSPLLKGRRTGQNVFLLLASLVFYGWGEPVFVFLMIFSVLITWLIGRGLSVRNSGKLLALGISYHVLLLFIFKYLTFAAEQIGLLLHKDLSFISISLPVGISFFTFQLMSYLFDVYYRKAAPQKNPLYVGLYATLFPQLIAGPIVRYEQIEKQIMDRRETYEGVVLGMERFIYGLAKKVLLSNYVAQIADNVFDYLAGNTTVAMAWLGAVSYALQIYFDFSGYSDMAIGLGAMFGFSFEENFRYPYIAKSVTDFWRRWHISLSTWFRDYVYIPLGGNRVKKSRWILNLFLVWLLTGLWHGANWTFVVWGLFYFVFLLVEKLTGFPEKIGRLSHVYTLILVTLAWVIFRAENLEAALGYLGNLFGIGAVGLWDSTVTAYIKATAWVLVAACIGVTPMVRNFFLRLKTTKARFLEPLWLTLLFVLSLFEVVGSTYNPFIYFNF